VLLVIDTEVYYWKDIKWIRGDKPSKEDFKKDYVKLPIDVAPVDYLEGVFHLLNNEDNPLGSKENQEWIRKNLKPNPHTSMSVGDIVKVVDEYWIVEDVGWKKLW